MSDFTAPALFGQRGDGSKDLAAAKHFTWQISPSDNRPLYLGLKILSAPQRRCGRKRMQYGCMERLNRKRGPEVWQFRWSVTGPDGKRLYHKKIVGTVERYLDEKAARRSVVGLVLEINTDARATNSGAITVAQLCDHFEQRELARENTWRSHATKKVYKAYL